MQLDITPSLVTSVSALVVALEHSPIGAAYLIALAVIVLAMLPRPK